MLSHHAEGLMLLGMDSIDAQCLLIQTLEAEMPPPDVWEHHRSGALSCAYSGGEKTFTWNPDAVATMAEQWRTSADKAPPERAQVMLDLHRRVEEMVRKAGRPRADAIVHDFGAGELRAVWTEDELVVVIGQLPAELPADWGKEG